MAELKREFYETLKTWKASKGKCLLNAKTPCGESKRSGLKLMDGFYTNLSNKYNLRRPGL